MSVYLSLIAVSQAKIPLLEISLSGGWQRPLHWLDWADTRDHDTSGSLQNSYPLKALDTRTPRSMS